MEGGGAGAIRPHSNSHPGLCCPKLGHCGQLGLAQLCRHKSEQPQWVVISCIAYMSWLWHPGALQHTVLQLEFRELYSYEKKQVRIYTRLCLVNHHSSRN